MFSSKEFEHPELGVIRITVNRRAKRIIMRAGDDSIRVTVPPFATIKEIEKALAKHGGRLKEMQEKKAVSIGNGKSFGNGNFRINIQEYKGERFMWVHNGSVITLMCPEATDYGEKQEWLRRVIVNAVTDEAKRVLPSRLKSLAEKHGFRYSNCSVRNSHSRWGSCSGQGNISLSIYLVLLPDELIDYVLLHELCHTIEMNHSERFWTLLDKQCGGRAKDIRHKLKRHSPGI